MKVKEPCFVHVNDETKFNDLVERVRQLDVMYWCDRESGIICVCNDRLSAMNGFRVGFDCGENIELFKALAAMNDEDWHNQYVVDNVGNWGLCEIIPDAGHLVCRCVTMLCLTFNIDNYRKATAEEIIEHFKNERK